jgi:hypothetical protein
MAVLKRMKEGLLLCDNIQMGSGQVFEEVLHRHNIVAHAYRDLAGVML